MMIEKMEKESPPNRSFSKSRLFIVFVLIIFAAWAAHTVSKPRVVPAQDPLTNIEDIETLRARFNEDVGKTRLILLVSPT